MICHSHLSWHDDHQAGSHTIVNEYCLHVHMRRAWPPEAFTTICGRGSESHDAQVDPTCRDRGTKTA